MAEEKLLVVDDEPSILNFLVRMLERDGYEVQSAHDGQEALDLLRARPFDLLLTDIKMDRLDGVELLNIARSECPDMAVILLTGHATVASAVAALQRGASNYLIKPVKKEDMLQAVRTALSERSREQRRDQLEAIADQMLQVMGQTPGTTAPTETEQKTIDYGGLRLDVDNYTAFLDGERLELTPTEFRLLVELSRSPGKTYDYVKLVQSACGYSCSRQEAQEIIGTHVRNLRSKLNINSGEPLYVEAVRGVGYRLTPNDE